MKKNIGFGYSKILLTFFLLLILESNCALLQEPESKIKAIIWDLGHVLVDTSKASFASEAIDVTDIIQLSATSLFNLDMTILTKIQEKTLNLILDYKKQTPTENGLVLKHENVELGEIMCQWLRGEIQGEEVISALQEHIKICELRGDVFSCESEKNVISNIINLMFNSRSLAYHTKPIEKIIPVLKDCKDNGLKMVMLTNWNNRAFEALYNSEHTKEIFDFFRKDEIFVSGYLGVTKPSALAYKHVTDLLIVRYGIKPEECLMIDDQPENIEGARLCGIQGVLFGKGKDKCELLRSDLIRLRLLPAMEAEVPEKGWFSSIWS